MNKIAKAAKKKVRSAGKANAVINYMGGISYELSPVEEKSKDGDNILDFRRNRTITGMENSPEKPCGLLSMMIDPLFCQILPIY